MSPLNHSESNCRVGHRLILQELDAGWPQLERLAGWPCVPTPEDSHRSFGKGDASIEFTPAQVRRR
jgi:hypothetical protein